MAFSDSNSPGTYDSRRTKSSHSSPSGSTLPNWFTAFSASFRNSGSDIFVRAYPTTANPSGRSRSTNRCQKAGISFRRVRSPDAPKMTTAWGSGGFNGMDTSREIGAPWSSGGQRARKLAKVHRRIPQQGRVDGLPSLDQGTGPADVLAPVQPHHPFDQPVLQVETGEVAV